LPGVTSFNQDAPARLAAVRAALDSGDADGVRRGAHAFTGSCSVLGLRRLQALGAPLESPGSAVAAEARRTFAAVEAERDRLRPWLRAERWHGREQVVEAI
jgi:HPt (histidine-containing phosphotransfer) domain-containing protein